MKKLYSLFLTLFISLATPLYIYALDGEYNGGAGEGGSLGGGTWDYAFQGYRVTLLNGTEPLYSDKSCVDILFSTPPADDNNNFICVNNGIKNAQTIIKDTLISETENIADLPLPIIGDATTYIPNGEAVRAYLEHGKLQEGGVAGGSGGNVMGSNDQTYFPPPQPPLNPAPGEPLTSEQLDKVFNLSLIYGKQMDDYVAIQLNRIEIEKRWGELGIPGSPIRPATPEELDSALQDIIVKALKVMEPYLTPMESETLSVMLEETKFHRYVKYSKIYLDSYTVKPMSANQQSINSMVIPLSNEPSGDGCVPACNPKMNPFIEACFKEYHADVINDIATAEDVRLLIETVEWYRPVTTTGVVAPYYVYGTASNIAEHNIENAGTYGNDHGALMAKLTNYALPNSMILSQADTVLDLNAPEKTGENVFIPSQEMLYSTN